MSAALREPVFSNLSTLELNHNKIRYLPAGAFNNYPKLRFLYLSSNYINMVDSTAFASLSNTLEEIRLNNNPLTRLPDLTPSGGRHLKLLLQNVPLHCNASLCWMLYSRKSITLVSAVCASPPEVTGISPLKSGDTICQSKYAPTRRGRIPPKMIAG